MAEVESVMRAAGDEWRQRNWKWLGGSSLWGGRTWEWEGKEHERDWGVRSEGVSGWELERKCKMFYQNFKCKIFYINLPSWFGWPEIFYFWLSILLQNKHSKIGKYIFENILHQNKQSVNAIIWLNYSF